MRSRLLFALALALLQAACGLQIGEKSASKAEGDSRPARGGAFDAPDDDGGGEGDEPAVIGEDEAEDEEAAVKIVNEDDDAPEKTAAAAATQAEPGTDAPDTSAEWKAASEGITADMRAHLQRRRKKADADQIKQSRGPIGTVLFGMGDFFRSTYFSNVRRSISVFVGMWFWYVLNTKTYVPPEIEE